MFSKPVSEHLRGTLPAAVGVGIKHQVDGPHTKAQLTKLVCVELSSHRASNVVKAGLPQHRVIEQALYENHYWTLPDLLPGVQAALGARQEAMRRRRGRQAAAVEVAVERKHDTMDVGVVSR